MTTSFSADPGRPLKETCEIAGLRLSARRSVLSPWRCRDFGLLARDKLRDFPSPEAKLNRVVFSPV